MTKHKNIKITISYKKSDSEIILVLNNNEEKEISEILRIIKNDDILVPIYHGVITDNKDGSQKENRII